MKPLTFRTKLTLFYSITVSLLLAGFALVSYRVLSVGLDNALSDELIERAAGLRGYLRFEEGKPVFIYDENDPEEALFVRTATRYFEVYEATSGTLLASSPDLQAMGVQYSTEEVQHVAQEPSSFTDLHTDQGKLRFRNEIIAGSFGDTYLLLVGASMQPMEDTVDAFLRSLAWLIPSGVLLAALAAWWMAGKALAPVAELAGAAREIVVSHLDRRLPVRGTDDELVHHLCRGRAAGDLSARLRFRVPRQPAPRPAPTPCRPSTTRRARRATLRRESTTPGIEEMRRRYPPSVAWKRRPEAGTCPQNFPR